MNVCLCGFGVINFASNLDKHDLIFVLTTDQILVANACDSGVRQMPVINSDNNTMAIINVFYVPVFGAFDNAFVVYNMTFVCVARVSLKCGTLKGFAVCFK